MNSSARSATTMKRLAAMHDCPLFCTRPVTAIGMVRSMSADEAMMKGSEPPSSRTHFLRTDPAAAATDWPAASEPVRVTAAIRGSAITSATREPGTKRFTKQPSGKPARRKRPSRRRAASGTFEACLRSPTLPAMRAGAAKRTTCQRGKFHGMTASTGPIGS